MEWTDWVKEFYWQLLKIGWTLPEIDAMDIYFYFKMLQHKSKTGALEQQAALDSMGL